MNHITIQSLFLNYSTSNSNYSFNFKNDIRVDIDVNVGENNFKFWYDCSSFFN